MIYESRFWKNDLLKQAKSLRSKTIQKRWTENSFARLEQSVMLGFYSIRKLIEAKKLSDSVANQSITVRFYVCKGKLVTRRNWGDIDELYDVNAPQSVTKDLLFFCHQFVHSYIFVPSFDDSNCLDGICISSDKERHKALYHIYIHQIIDIFEQVGNDYPVRSLFYFDEKLGDYRIQNWASDDANYKSEILKAIEKSEM
ncbi:hypothetical protein SAMD00079811_82820 (plasmid) [Scytonema sp. HK-05]|uniref:hypothetical protein n=1 Tax=Scytonema sp. HK-05 TaxID=1137095 RepID=UPI0009373FF0|nr:hypothetical protein [Scytonema sp. HK-05]OKH52365.1 hypothetical protein NIES2130_32005 [Scytonema sp. HK-05]BAY50651.1 hypothetical protein SAMD00079811_82820 [Scytonema sp. HK-05]